MTLDELVVKLVLDASGFNKGQADATAALKKTKDEAVTSSKAIEASALSASQGVEKLGRQFLGLYALLTGGREIKNFISDMTTTDAQLGRTAKNIDMSARSLSTWQGAAAAAGGSAQGITGSMANLSGAMQEAALTGNNKLAPVMRALGINLADAGGHARNVGAIMDDLNKSAQGIDPAGFSTMMKMIGIDDGTINLLEMNRTEFHKLMADMQKYAATSEDVDAAQKRQSGWRELLLTSESLGRSILTAVTPAIIGAMTAVQQWANANQEWIRTAIVEKVGEFVTWMQKLDWNEIGRQASGFAGSVRDIAVALSDTVKNIDGNSLIFRAFEAFGALLAGNVLVRLASVATAITGLGSMTLPTWLAGAIGLPLLGTAAVGAVLASGDPNKSVLAGGRPDVQPQDNDLGLPGVGDRTSDTSSVTRSTGQLAAAWDWLKKKTGFGDHLDPKLRDGIADTASATGEIRDILKRQADGLPGAAFNGVDVSSGGLGGTGHHADGSGAGASLRDRQFHGKGNFGQKGWWTPERQSYGIDYLMKNAGLTEDGAKALVSRWRFVESPGGPTAVNPKSGAAGIAQGLGSRRAGYTGSFDDQLKNAARELNGSEGRAKKLLNTPGMAAVGASQFERAEGYDPKTGRDNFTDRVAEGMKHIAHGVAPSTATAQDPVPAGTSSKAIGDAEVFAARQRIIAGSKNPKDRAIIEQYGREQTQHAGPTGTTPAVTLDHAVRHILSTIHHAQRLTRHGDRPVPVEVTDKGADNISKRTFGRYIHATKPLAGEMPHAHRPDHVGAIARMTHIASVGRYGVSNSRVSNSEHTIHGGIHVHTAATDAKGIASDLEPYLFQGRDARQANRGLA